MAFLLAAWMQPTLAQFDDAWLKKRATGLWQLGYYHQSRGSLDSAIKIYQRSIDTFPTAEAYTFLGWALSFKDQYGAAIENCMKAIDIDPEFGNPYNDIGAYLIELGRDQEALPWLEKATRARRYCCYEFAWTNLGRLHLRRGRIGDARAAFRRALEYDPRNPLALEGLTALAEGRAPNF
ncbi:MAG: tetratricopeptide repeat protein [Gammaproteobacteria bacterium]|nr:tetratricopeptide repeat protein [Gammaproteobacteria bacterium]